MDWTPWRAEDKPSSTPATPQIPLPTGTTESGPITSAAVSPGIRSTTAQPSDKASQLSSPSHTGPALNPRSCNTCRRRKVKCDKVSPCSNCRKANIECVFPGPGRAPRRLKQSKPSSERETELLKRLRRLEGVVEELSGQVEVESARLSPVEPKVKELPRRKGSLGSGNRSPLIDKSDSVSTPAIPWSKPSTGPELRVKGMDEGNTETKTWISRIVALGHGPPRHEDMHLNSESAKVVVEGGKSRYISNEFWVRLNSEVADIREMADDYSNAGTDEEGFTPEYLWEDTEFEEDNHQSFIMGYSSSMVDLKSLHPKGLDIPKYWKIYVENVEPLIKLLHSPTMDKTIKEVVKNVGGLSRSTEALMFAIYFSAITSMSPDDCRDEFGSEKHVLVKKYRFATEQALSRAGFLTSSEMVTIQAFVLFLICVRRHDDTKAVWSLTGLVIRLGQALGLHRDGRALGLSVFDTEMRRRVWWQICVLDIRSSEDFGTEPAIDDFTGDTQFPSNYNDEDFEPSTEVALEPRVGVSEMTFCLVRYEICKMARKISFTVLDTIEPNKNASNLETLAEKEKIVQDLHEHLELRYLQHCDNAGPLFWVAATVARLVLSKMSLMIYGFRGDPTTMDRFPQNVRDRLLVAAVEIMEYSQLLKEGSSTKQWGWLFNTYVQWHAIAYILREVCVRPRTQLAERGWRAVNNVFASWNESLKKNKSNGQLWLPMRKLMIKARRSRQATDGKMKKDTPFRGVSTVETNDAQRGGTATRPQQYPLYENQPSLSGVPQAQQQNPATIDTTSSNFTSPLVSDGSMWTAGFVNGPNTSETHFFQDQASTVQNQNQYMNNQPLMPPLTGSEWLLDESALMDMDLDLELTAGDGDVNDVDWAVWDDIVRQYTNQNSNPNFTTIGSQGNGPTGASGYW